MATAPRIRKLDEVVVNRIAAGEVIQRPANALKEMIENSLDAGSSMITVTVKNGGLKLMQIQDNGCGIRKDDMEIVCERFTTSKLTKFEDLLNIHTYGFRGEALASISHVAHVTICTKTSDSPVGYKACYEDGKLKGQIKACAALQGTQIRVEDLFYNIATRRKALKNYTEEYGKIFNVVSRYAIHNSSIGFCLKKEGENNTDVKTSIDSTVTDNIRTIYGNNLAKELIEIKGEDEMLQFKINGFITNPNYSDKKFKFLLFINNRLVESNALKKTIDQIFATYLPKGNHPFAYLSIELNPANVDVNVHPTKHEVHFLHEEAIVDKIRTIIESKLCGANSSRTMYTQAKMPMNFTLIDKTLQEKKQPSEMVRVDGNEQKLDKFFKETDKTDKNPNKRVIKLKSILQIRADVENNADKGLVKFVKNFVFVGVVNPIQCLVQHETKLFLCNTLKLVTELFYQLVVFDFANFGIIKFSTPISIVELAMIYLDSDISGWKQEDGPKLELAQDMLTLLQEKSAMLEDYFSIEIIDDTICSLPLLLDQHVPNMALLPDFIVRVCTEVDWELEQPCLDGIARELARFYSHLSINDDEMDNVADSKWKWQVEHILMPGIKASLLPPSVFATDGTLLEIAHLPDLYRVFERC